MRGNVKNLINSRKWQLEFAKKLNIELPEIENPSIKENTQCLIGMSEFSSEKELRIMSYVYPSLMSHNFVSILPYHPDKEFVVGYHGDFFQTTVKDIHRLDFGEIEYPQDSLGYFADVAKKTTLGWDGFAINKLEQAANIKYFAFSVWGISINEQIRSLKHNVEDRSGLPVTWILMNCRILSSLQKEDDFYIADEQWKYLSGFYAGRWEGADIYCVDSLPRDCIALMGYRGNIYNDASFIVPVNKIVSTERQGIYGYGNFISCLEWTENCLGKLQIC